MEGTDIVGWVGGEAELRNKQGSERNGQNWSDVRADDAPSSDSWIALRSDGCPKT